jgi:hypothetical protein
VAELASHESGLCGVYLVGKVRALKERGELRDLVGEVVAFSLHAEDVVKLGGDAEGHRDLLVGSSGGGGRGQHSDAPGGAGEDSAKHKLSFDGAAQLGEVEGAGAAGLSDVAVSYDAVDGDRGELLDEVSEGADEEPPGLGRGGDPLQRGEDTDGDGARVDPRPPWARACSSVPELGLQRVEVGELPPAEAPQARGGEVHDAVILPPRVRGHGIAPVLALASPAPEAAVVAVKLVEAERPGAGALVMDYDEVDGVEGADAAHEGSMMSW